MFFSSTIALMNKDMKDCNDEERALKEALESAALAKQEENNKRIVSEKTEEGTRLLKEQRALDAKIASIKERR